MSWCPSRRLTSSIGVPLSRCSSACKMMPEVVRRPMPAPCQIKKYPQPCEPFDARVCIFPSPLQKKYLLLSCGAAWSFPDKPIWNDGPQPRCRSSADRSGSCWPQTWDFGRLIWLRHRGRYIASGERMLPFALAMGCPSRPYSSGEIRKYFPEGLKFDDVNGSR